MSRRTKFLVLLSFIVILLVVVPAYWYQIVSTSTGVEDTVASQLSSQLGRHVTVGSVRIKPNGSIIVERVIVDDKGQILLNAKEVVVKYNVWHLFMQNPLGGVRSIEFQQPEIFVSRNDVSGEWNIVRLLNDLKKPDQSTTLHAVFRIKDGKIYVNNGEEGTGKREQGTIVVEKVDAEFDFTGNPSLSVQGNGLLAGNPVGVKGFIHTQKGAYGFQIDAQGQRLQTIAPWLPKSGIDIKAGVIDTSIYLWQEPYQTIQYSGELNVQDASIRVDKMGYELSGINGKVFLTNAALFLQNVNGKINGEPVTAAGSIALDGMVPYLDITVKSEGMTVQKALPDKEIPVDGKAQFSIHARGPINNPHAQGEMSLPTGTVHGVPVEHVTARLVYTNNWVDILDIKADVYGGKIQGQGVIKLATMPVYNLFLQLDGVQSPHQDVKGTITASVYATGNGNEAISTLWGAGRLEKGTLMNVPYDVADTGFYWDNQQLHLDYFKLSLGGGWVQVSGTGSAQKLDLNVQGSKLPLERVAVAAGNPCITGLGNIKGKVQGTFNDPYLEGTFEAVDGTVLQQSFERSTGEFFLTKQKLVLANTVATYKSTLHTLRGTIMFTPEILLDMRISSKNAPADEIVKLFAKQESLNGRINNEVSIKGPLTNLQIAGQATLVQGEYRGQRIDRIQSSYAYVDGLFHIKNATVASGSATLELTGTMSRQGELNMNLAGKNIRLEEIKGGTLPYSLGGRAEFTGAVTGTWDNPRANMNLKAYDTIINGQRFGDLSGYVEFMNKQLTVSELKLRQGPACYEFAGRLDLNKPEQIEGTLTVRDGQVPQLLSLLAYPIPDAQGKVNADLLLSGNVQKPDAKGRLVITQGNVKGYTVDKIDVDVAVDKGLVTVNTLELLQGQGFMRAQGTWDPGGIMAFEVGGKNLDAGFVAALLPNPQPVKGSINFTAQVGGTTQAPQAAMSVEIRQGSWASAEFDSLYALVLLDDDILKINQIMLIKGPYRASAYGRVPLAALSSKGREDPSSPAGMDIRMRLDQADLSILPLLSKEVAWAIGQTQGEVRIGGNLHQPYIFGNFTVKDGTIKLRALNNPIEHANINIEFEGDKIRLETLNGQLGGGSYTGYGTAVLKGFSLDDLNFKLNLDKLYVNNKYYVGPVQGAFSLESAGARRPILKGNLYLDTVEISPPVFWPESYNALPDIRLDVELQADKNVRLRNPALYDMYIQGKVKAQGTLKHPITSGRVTVTRGTLQYLSTPFRITEGVADFNQYDSFLPTIRVLSEARTLETKIYLQVTGPLSQMELNLTSDPSLSQQQIIKLLTLREKKSGGSSEPGQSTGGDDDAGSSGDDDLSVLLHEGLQFTFVQRVEKVMEDFLGVDEFHIVRGENATVTDREVYNLEVGKFVDERLFLGYTLGLDQTDRTFRFRYDITSHLALDGEVDDEENGRFGLEARFSF